MKNLTSSDLDGSTCVWTHFSRGIRISRSHDLIWPVASVIAKTIYGHEERVRQCSPIGMVQLVSRPIFQGESKSEEGNLKFSLWVLIQPYPRWVWGEGWVTFPNLDGSICT